MTTQENAIKMTFAKRFVIPMNFDFFNYTVYPYELKAYLIVRFELNSSEKAVLYSGDTAATYKLLTFL